MFIKIHVFSCFDTPHIFFIMCEITWNLNAFNNRIEGAYLTFRMILNRSIDPYFYDLSLHCRILFSFFYLAIVRWYVDALMRWCIDTLMHWYVDTLMRWYVDTLISWCVDSYRNFLNLAISIIYSNSFLTTLAGDFNIKSYFISWFLPMQCTKDAFLNPTKYTKVVWMFNIYSRRAWQNQHFNGIVISSYPCSSLINIAT